MSADQARARREKRWLDTVRRLTLRAVADLPVDVYLFGSRARGDACRTSDIDIAIDPRGDVPRRVISDLREALEECHVPVRIDVIDLRDARADFRARVLGEGIRWSV